MSKRRWRPSFGQEETGQHSSGEFDLEIEGAEWGNQARAQAIAEPPKNPVEEVSEHAQALLGIERNGQLPRHLQILARSHLAGRAGLTQRLERLDLVANAVAGALEDNLGTDAVEMRIQLAAACRAAVERDGQGEPVEEIVAMSPLPKQAVGAVLVRLAEIELEDEESELELGYLAESRGS